MPVSGVEFQVQLWEVVPVFAASFVNDHTNQPAQGCCGTPKMRPLPMQD